MTDEHEKIEKQSYVCLFFSYSMYFHDIRLMHLLIDEIGQLGIITVYGQGDRRPFVVKIELLHTVINYFAYGPV